MKFQPKYVITNSMLQDLTTISRARGFLDAAILSADWIQEMQNKALLLEAHHTTHIEGTELTLDQSKRLMNGEILQNADPDDARELLNYKDAFNLVADYLNDNAPITEGLIREVHKLLVLGVRGNSAAPGEYRKIQNYVINSQTGETIYTPPPAFEIGRMMQEMVDYINTANDVNPIIVSGIAQFQLVHIHPFLDGNGRTARLLSTLCLYRQGYDFKKLFTISEYYDRNRIDYYKAIQSVRENKMDYTFWLEYFIHALAEQMQEIQIKGEMVIQSDVLVKKHKLTERQGRVLQYILQHGELTIKNFEDLCVGVPRRSLQRDLKELITKNLIFAEGATNQLAYKLVL